MARLRFGIIGAGFWARSQLAAWQELTGAACVAVCDRERDRASRLAQAYGVAAVYGDAAEMLRRESLDFVDVVTDVDSHAPLVRLALGHGVPVICQKPMAPSLAEAAALVGEAHAAGVPFFVHENWRWQTPLRALKAALDSGRIGRPFRARVEMISGFPVFDNQPYFRELEQFLLTDMGSHILDVPRFLFGEAESLCCHTDRMHPDIRGEDVATVMLRLAGPTTVVCTMAYAENALERECFPQTLVFVEAEQGSLELACDYWLRQTTSEGTFSRRVPPPRYAWADPEYALAQSAAVACNRNLLAALAGEGAAETTAEDNLKTLELVFGAYESARTGTVVRAVDLAARAGGEG